MVMPANLTYSQLETRVMNSLRIPVSNTVERDKVAAVINETYRDICAKQDWWWLKKQHSVNTVPKIMAGTVALTENSQAITFSDIPARRNLDGTAGVQYGVQDWMLSIPGQADDPSALYRISAHTPGNVTATLDSPYTGATTAAAGYRLYLDTFNLPRDVDKLLTLQRFGQTQPAERIGLEEMKRLKQFDRTEGWPQVYSVFDFEVTGDPTYWRQLYVHPFPDKAYRMEIWYKQHVNTELFGTKQPFIPDSYRQVLIYGALSRAYPIFLNDAERGAFYLALFNDLMALMSAQNKEYADDALQLVPEMRGYRPRRRRPRTAYTLGSWFDRLPQIP
jgi:hypothetical protein